MAGLLCASSLEKRGVKSTVFDTVGQLFPFSTLFSIWVSFLVLVDILCCDCSQEWLHTCILEFDFFSSVKEINVFV